jgi:hypothetical protein
MWVVGRRCTVRPLHMAFCIAARVPGHTHQAIPAQAHGTVPQGAAAPAAPSRPPRKHLRFSIRVATSVFRDPFSPTGSYPAIATGFPCRDRAFARCPRCRFVQASTPDYRQFAVGPVASEHSRDDGRLGRDDEDPRWREHMLERIFLAGQRSLTRAPCHWRRAPRGQSPARTTPSLETERSSGSAAHRSADTMVLRKPFTSVPTVSPVFNLLTCRNSTSVGRGAGR